MHERLRGQAHIEDEETIYEVAHRLHMLMLYELQDMYGIDLTFLEPDELFRRCFEEWHSGKHLKECNALMF